MKFFAIEMNIPLIRVFSFICLPILALTSWEKTSLASAPSCELQFFGDFFVDEARIDEVSKYHASLLQLTSSCKNNIANFEGSIGGELKNVDKEKQYNLKMSDKVPILLKTLNIQYVSLANNHSLDFGWKTAESTKEILLRAGVKTFGIGGNLKEASQPLEIDSVLNKKRFCVFAFNHTFPESYFAKLDQSGTAHLNFKERELLFKQYEDKCDYKFAFIHWGREREYDPQEYQNVMAKELVKGGFDVVLGHHPHIVQKVEFISNKLVFYSLGNFVFATKPMGVISSGGFVRFLQDDSGRTGLEMGVLNTDNQKVHYRPFVADEKNSSFKKISEKILRNKKCKIKKENNYSLISCFPL